jgi:type IV secretory pathway VirD2 relaxase
MIDHKSTAQSQKSMQWEEYKTTLPSYSSALKRHN